MGKLFEEYQQYQFCLALAAMAAGAQNALHFHYDQSNVEHSKVHSGCTPFILNEEVAAAVQ